MPPSHPRAHEQRPRAARTIALTLVGSVALLVAGCAAWRLAESRALARASESYSQPGLPGGPRLLIVGDSTAVGTGASSPRTSVAGRIGERFPSARIDNFGVDGATFADVVRQLGSAPAGAPRYDIALVMAGGNDVIRLRDMDTVRTDVGRAIRLARERAVTVVVMPAGNVGNAPFFWPPVSWWMTARARDLQETVAAESAEQGAVYVSLFREREKDPFAHDRGLNAADGLHPSDSGYALWWRALQEQAALDDRLASGQR